MSLRLYNTLTRQKEPFQPIDPDNVRMYVCGPTVYDFAHIGNARPVIVFDVLFRLLREIYGAQHVTYVRNITDVDDKINARAAERYPDLAPELGIRKLTEETAAQFHKDIAALGVLMPEQVNRIGEPKRFIEPRATEHIVEMVQLCDQLVDKGHAYVAADHVLFDVSSMADYGKLSNRSLEEMEAGSRVEVAPYKKGPMDFVLWKPSKPGEPAWPSPAGIATPGRPGWHIECSAMAGKHLGDVFDIHGGGIDLTFPHHENEIAQSRCAHGTDVMAQVWMHNGFLQVEGEKMSKSLGNFITINELLETGKFGGRPWEGAVVRLAMLKTHYRQPIDWTRRLLEEAAKNYELLGSVRYDYAPTSVSAAVLDALEDDLNTKAAVDVLLELADRARRGDHIAGGELVASLHLLGFLIDDIARGGPGFMADHLNRIILSETEIVGGMSEFVPKNIPVKYVRRKILEENILDLPLEVRREIGQYLRYASADTYSGDIWSDPIRAKHANELVEKRLEARKRKDFKESDRIRDELAEMGVALKDTKNKDTGEIETTWELQR
jgi:cysteinyl-tRNA synthetase